MLHYDVNFARKSSAERARFIFIRLSVRLNRTRRNYYYYYFDTDTWWNPGLPFSSDSRVPRRCNIITCSTQRKNWLVRMANRYNGCAHGTNDRTIPCGSLSSYPIGFPNGIWHTRTTIIICFSAACPTSRLQTVPERCAVGSVAALITVQQPAAVVE